MKFRKETIMNQRKKDIMKIRIIQAYARYVEYGFSQSVRIIYTVKNAVSALVPKRRK